MKKIIFATLSLIFSFALVSDTYATSPMPPYYQNGGYVGNIGGSSNGGSGGGFGGGFGSGYGGGSGSGYGGGPFTGFGATCGNPGSFLDINGNLYTFTGRETETELLSLVDGLKVAIEQKLTELKIVQNQYGQNKCDLTRLKRQIAELKKQIRDKEREYNDLSLYLKDLKYQHSKIEAEVGKVKKKAKNAKTTAIVLGSTTAIGTAAAIATGNKALKEDIVKLEASTLKDNTSSIKVINNTINLIVSPPPVVGKAPVQAKENCPDCDLGNFGVTATCVAGKGNGVYNYSGAMNLCNSLRQNPPSTDGKAPNSCNLLCGAIVKSEEVVDKSGSYNSSSVRSALASCQSELKSKNWNISIGFSGVDCGKAIETPEKVIGATCALDGSNCQ